MPLMVMVLESTPSLSVKVIVMLELMLAEQAAGEYDPDVGKEVQLVLETKTEGKILA